MHLTLIKLTKNYANYQEINLVLKESLQWVLVQGI
jgi:hypothetical protein